MSPPQIGTTVLALLILFDPTEELCLNPLMMVLGGGDFLGARYPCTSAGPSFRALSGRLKSAVRHHKFDNDSMYPRAGGLPARDDDSLSLKATGERDGRHPMLRPGVHHVSLPLRRLGALPPPWSRFEGKPYVNLPQMPPLRGGICMGVN